MAKQQIYILYTLGLPTCMSRLMGKPTICIGEHKGADQLCSNCEADQRLCFRYSDNTIHFLLKPKFQASSSFLCLYRSVCVGLVRKPHCCFSTRRLIYTCCQTELQMDIIIGMNKRTDLMYTKYIPPFLYDDN